jgi:transposase
MEATGIYSMPVHHALIEHGQFEKVLVGNAGHVRNVPGRKTDLSDAEWLVHLLECGLLRGSFIPPAQIKAARDVIRYRTKLTESRTSERQRLGNVLQDAGIKVDSGGLDDHHPVRAGDGEGPHRWRAPPTAARRLG